MFVGMGLRRQARRAAKENNRRRRAPNSAAKLAGGGIASDASHLKHRIDRRSSRSFFHARRVRT